MVRRRLLFVFCSLVHHSNRPLFMWLQSSTDQEPSKIPKPICRSLVTKQHDRVLSDEELKGCVKGRQEIAHVPTKEKGGRSHGTRLYLNIKIVTKIIISSNRKPSSLSTNFQERKQWKQGLTRVRIKRSSSIHNSTQLASGLRTATIQKATEPQQEHPSPFPQQELSVSIALSVS